MVKSKAVQQYLLTSAEASRLPCLTVGDTSQPLGAVKLVLRAHAEQLATQRCVCVRVELVVRDV
jgi:hypothetical protein